MLRELTRSVAGFVHYPVLPSNGVRSGVTRRKPEEQVRRGQKDLHRPSGPAVP